MSQTTYVEYQGVRSPFEIQPRCRVGRMQQVIGQALGIDPDYFTIKRHGSLIDTIYMTNNTNKFLLEDCGIKANDIIGIFGKTNNAVPFIENSINVHFVHNSIKFYKCAIAKTCSVRILRGMIQQSNLFLPQSIKLKYQNNYLTNDNKLLIDDIGIKDNDEIQVEAVFFPLKETGFEFIDNTGIRIEKDCCICLEVMNKGKIFACGHVNVCGQCQEKYNKNNCPLCHHNEM